jgi:alpha-1,6-mannosyltransferase
MVGVASGGIAELVDEDVGQLASKATPEAMAEAICALFERDTAAIGATARIKAETHYGWDATFLGLSALYGDLCGAPVAAGPPLPFPRGPL